MFHKCFMLGPCRFQRCFISVPATINIAHGVGLRFSAVDAAFSKHPIYRQGYLHLLTTRDSNNHVLVLCWAICETESGDTYTWFANEVHLAGLSTYLAKGIIYSDRQKGIEEFHNKFGAFIGKCFKHMIGNAQKKVKGTGQTFQEETAWNLQKAPTRAEYEAQLEQMRKESSIAAKYFDEECIPHDEVYQYAMNDKKVANHDFKTSQIVECANGVFVPARACHPYYMNEMILEWVGQKLAEHTTEMIKWAQKNHPLTKYSHELYAIQVEIAKRSGNQVLAGGGDIYRVKNMAKPERPAFEVNLQKPECCPYYATHRQPCRHMIIVFHHKGMLGGTARQTRQTIEKWWPKCFKSEYYVHMYKDKCVRCPKTYPGPFTGPDADRCEPPKQTHAKRGRPKKQRYRWSKQTKKTVKDRMPIVYRADYASCMRHF